MKQKKVPNEVIRLAPFFKFLHAGLFDFTCSQGLTAYRASGDVVQ